MFLGRSLTQVYKAISHADSFNIKTWLLGGWDPVKICWSQILSVGKVSRIDLSEGSSSFLEFRVMASRLVLTCTFAFWGAAAIKVCQNNKPGHKVTTLNNILSSLVLRKHGQIKHTSSLIKICFEYVLLCQINSIEIRKDLIQNRYLCDVEV